MPNHPKPRFEYFVSVGIMTQGGNPLGHSFLMVSTIDHLEGKNARVEVLETMGFYSRYMPVIGYKPYSRGRVKVEEPKDFVGKNGLHHRTFQINQTELGELLTAINQDRRMLGDDKPIPHTNHYRPGGPIFNLFIGDNCKRYALNKLRNIGIDVSNMHSWLEIPRFTQGVTPLTIAHQKRQGKDTYYWTSPLLVSPRCGKTSTLDHEKIVLTRQFFALKEGVDKIYQKLQLRHEELLSQGRKVEEITIAFERMHQLRDQLAQNQSLPNSITFTNIVHWQREVAKTVGSCIAKLKQKGIEQDFIHKLLDFLNEMVHKIRVAVFGVDSIHASHANSKDNLILNEVDELQEKVTRYKCR